MVVQRPEIGLREAADDSKSTSNGSDNIRNFSGYVWEYLWIQFRVCKCPCLLPAPRAVTSVDSGSCLPSDTPVPLEGLLVRCQVSEHPHTHFRSPHLQGRSWRPGVKEPAQVQARILTSLTSSSLLTSRQARQGSTCPSLGQEIDESADN